MTSLITRLQAAPKGSRELSDEVLLAMGWHYEPEHIGHAWQSPDRSWRGFDDRPDPTRDLTDAVAMVPEGWHWNVATTQGKKDKGGWAGVHPTEMQVASYKPLEGRAATPVLALCVAIIKAREQTK